MKNLTIRLFAAVSLMVGAALLSGCNEDRVTYDGPEYVMFSDSLYTLAVQSDEEIFDIPVVSMHTSGKDRNFAVEIIDKESNAIEGCHYELLSNTVTIKAGKRVANVQVRGMYSNFDPTDSLGFTLKLICDNELVSPLYGNKTSVVLQKCIPFDINTFTGYCLISRSTYFDSYMASISQRLITSEIDPNEENTVILKNFMYDGYDIKLKFETEDPLTPAITCEEQVFASTGEAFGTVYGDGNIIIYSPSSYPSYFSMYEKYVLLYMTLKVENVGTVGLFGTIMRWVSDDEAEKLKKEGL